MAGQRRAGQGRGGQGKAGHLFCFVRQFAQSAIALLVKVTLLAPMSAFHTLFYLFRELKHYLRSKTLNTVDITLITLKDEVENPDF